MKARVFNRQVVLVVPFLVIFYFPLAASIYTGLFHQSIDWNKSLQGLTGSAPVSQVDLGPKTWWEGSFQKGFANWWEGNCPGRGFFLRLFNQVNYSCLSSSYMLQSGIMIGPGGQLDSAEYVLDACHQGAFPADHVPQLMDKIERLQAQLRKQGKSLLVMTTPDKAVTYPETVPGRFRAYDASRPRAYEELIKALKLSGIPLVDGAGIIHGLAGQSPYPLFVRGGVHWDTYAAAQVLPALVEKITQLTGKPLVAPTVASVQMVRARQSQSQTDHDLAGLLNLLSRPFGYLCPNITLNYPAQPPGPEPNIAWAGGSFSWQLLELLGKSPVYADRPPLPMAFYADRFFYGEPSHPISRQNYVRALASSDVVVLEMNENLPQSTVNGLPALIDGATEAAVKPDDEISFAQGGNSPEFVTSGFSAEEDSCRWTDGETASFVVPLPGDRRPYVLTAKVAPFLSGASRHQRVEIRAGDQLCGRLDLKSEGIQNITATFTASELVKIDFYFPDAISSPDGTGKKALAFYSLEISPAKNPPTK